MSHTCATDMNGGKQPWKLTHLEALFAAIQVPRVDDAIYHKKKKVKDLRLLFPTFGNLPIENRGIYNFISFGLRENIPYYISIPKALRGNFFAECDKWLIPPTHRNTQYHTHPQSTQTTHIKIRHFPTPCSNKARQTTAGGRFLNWKTIVITTTDQKQWVR